METFPWKIEENLKIAVEVALQVFLCTKTKGTSLLKQSLSGSDRSRQRDVHVWGKQGSLEKQ